ncbi:UDP-2,3-diacylglucosamine diphosphatase LpxI domain-containing protein [Rhodospirillaceae bacterium SYSU D60014]|uniref:LpxI family protein n=1 Tax=Virgifigura deserti TaxID=2268457 RepID=UPI000E671B90
MSPKLGILAGGGALPLRLIAACRAVGRDVFVLAFDGQTDRATVADVPHAWVRLGAAGRAIELLRAAGVEELVMAGGIRRPSLAMLRPDQRAARFLAKAGGRLFSDDGLLKAIIDILEREEGFRVVEARSLLTSLTVGRGPLGQRRPSPEDERDIAWGVEVARQLGRLDIGQAVVVCDGIVLGVEAAEGTDALIERCRALRGAKSGGVLVKVLKPQQEHRADPPTIGLETVRRAAIAGLHGIAVEAGGALVIDAEAVAQAADAAGLFVVGIGVDN